MTEEGLSNYYCCNMALTGLMFQLSKVVALLIIQKGTSIFKSDNKTHFAVFTIKSPQNQNMDY